MLASQHSYDVPGSSGQINAMSSESQMLMREQPDQEALDQLLRRIREAPIIAQPSPNIYFEKALPEALYQELLSALPEDDELDFIEHPDAYAPDGRRTRKLLALTDDFVERFHPTRRMMWRRLSALFTAPQLIHAIVEKFRGTLDIAYPDGLPDLVMVPIFYRDFPGYRISIHPDAVSKVATLQLYLPTDAAQRHLGTSFHRRTESGFEELATNPFMPNSGYAFARTNESWHSVKEIGAGERARNSIALTLYVKGKEFHSPPAGNRQER